MLVNGVNVLFLKVKQNEIFFSLTKVEIKRKFLGDVTTNPSFLQSQTQDQKIETILTSIYKLETVMGGLTPLHNPSLLKSFIFYIQTKKFCKKNFTKKIYLFVIGLYLINMAGEKKKKKKKHGGKVDSKQTCHRANAKRTGDTKSTPC